VRTRWAGWRQALAVVLSLALAASGSAQTLPDLGDSAQSALTPQNERRLGEFIMREIRRDPAFLDDPEITAYVESMGQRLVAVSPEARARSSTSSRSATTASTRSRCPAATSACTPG
jgi:predicted Zn-dependent protease